MLDQEVAHCILNHLYELTSFERLSLLECDAYTQVGQQRPVLQQPLELVGDVAAQKLSYRGGHEHRPKEWRQGLGLGAPGWFMIFTMLGNHVLVVKLRVIRRSYIERTTTGGRMQRVVN